MRAPHRRAARAAARIAVVIVAAAGAACGGGDEPTAAPRTPRVLDLLLDTATHVVATGHTRQLVATPYLDAPTSALLPPLVWSSADPTVATITPSGLLTAVRPGRTAVSVRLSTDERTLERSVGVRVVEPVARIEGRVVSLDGSPLAPLAVTVRHAGGAETVPVGADGAFHVALRAPVGDDSIIVVVDARSSAARTHIPSLGILPLDDAARPLAVAMVPRSFAIASGPFAGRPIAPSMRAAFDDSCRACERFYAMHEGARWITSWPSSRFPLPLAIWRERSTVSLGAADSVELWRNIGTLEAQLGVDLFTPAVTAGMERVPNFSTGFQQAVVVVVDTTSSSTLSAIGSMIATNTTFTATVKLRLRSQIGGPALRHELLHVIGAHHTCRWPTVMFASAGCSDPAPDSSPEDAIHARLLLLERAVRDAHPGATLLGLVEAFHGERAVLGGLTPRP